ncbi:hypothetical protein RRG08_011112 [Elysia crispata]|uniref:Contactin n=1 Tax=Elysia crispata TaxID=231223 RepID=A0AAE1DQJ9_9GAST|nr:hypothetical protein RRG08_011112 [Elysia crispata]
MMVGATGTTSALWWLGPLGQPAHYGSVFFPIWKLLVSVASRYTGSHLVCRGWGRTLGQLVLPVWTYRAAVFRSSRAIPGPRSDKIGMTGLLERPGIGTQPGRNRGGARGASHTQNNSMRKAWGEIGRREDAVRCVNTALAWRLDMATRDWQWLDHTVNMAWTHSKLDTFFAFSMRKENIFVDVELKRILRKLQQRFHTEIFSTSIGYFECKKSAAEVRSDVGMDHPRTVLPLGRRGLSPLMLPLAVLFLARVSLSSAQESDECPVTWYEHANRCYKFEQKSAPVQLARIQCQQDWATLASVRSAADHAFIQKQLETKTAAGQEWFTGGYRAPDESLKWLADGSDITTDFFPSDAVRKQMNVDYGLNIPQNRIVYKYDATGKNQSSFVWGWSRVMSPGGYICQIDKADTWKIFQQRRDFSYGTGVTDPSQWKTGPHITYQSPDTLFFKTESGSTPVVLDCQATGNPTPKYRWFRNKLGQSSRQEVTAALGPNYGITNGRLTITNPSDTKDSSIYTCEATNDIGTVRSNPIELAYGILDEFSPNPISSTPARMYQGVEVTCQSISTNTDLAYNWNKGSVRSFIRPDMNPQYFLSKNGRLYISEVRAEDQGDYQCMVEMVPRQGQVLAVNQAPSRTSKPIKLEVLGNNANTYGPDIQDKFPQFFPTEPMVGERVEMECLAYGRLPLRYSWKREDGPLNPQAQLADHNRRLIIPIARLEDTGTYTCIVKSSTNTAEKTAYLSLKARPSFPYPLRNQHLDKGSDFEWRCNAIGIPLPTYTWFKNGEKLQDDAAKGITVRGSILTIKDVGTEHEGMYQCEARNTNGMARSSAQLRSLSLAPTFSLTPVESSKQAAQGGEVTISCSPQAAPRAKIRWEKNGAEVGTVLPNGDLHLTDLKVADSGKYTCVAINDLGEDRSSCVLTVQEMSVFSEMPEDQTIIINESAIFPCKASFDRAKTDIVYSWKFYDHVIDFSGRNDDIVTYNMPNAVDREDGTLYITAAKYEHEGMYTCVVSSVTGSIATSAYLTVNGPPGEPGGVHARGASDDKGFQGNLELWWQKGYRHGFDVTNYVIEYRSYFDPKDTWTVLIDDLPDSETYLESYPDWQGYWIKGQLSPGTMYNFRVTSCNSQVGCSPPSMGPYVYYRMDSAPPIVAPDNVGGGGGATGLLQMTWDPLPRSKWGGNTISYILYYRKYEENTIDGQWEVVKTKNPYYYTVVGEENYYLPYEVKVQVQNEKGIGPNSTIAMVYSAEILPTLTPTFVAANAVNGTAGIVEWIGVPNTREAAHGKIGGYQINYWDGGDTLCLDTFEADAQSINFYGEATEGMLIGMNPGGDYCVNIQLYNVAGLGPKTDNYYLGMNDAPPSKYPEYVIVMSQGEESVRLLYDGVKNDFGEEPIGGYKAWWWQIEEDIRTATETDFGKMLTGVIHGVEKDRIYRLRMMAYSAGGNGAKGPEVFFTLGGQVRYDRLTTEILNSSPPAGEIISPLRLLFLVVTSVWISQMWD